MRKVTGYMVDGRLYETLEAALVAEAQSFRAELERLIETRIGGTERTADAILILFRERQRQEDVAEQAAEVTNIPIEDVNLSAPVPIDNFRVPEAPEGQFYMRPKS